MSETFDPSWDLSLEEFLTQFTRLTNPNAFKIRAIKHVRAAGLSGLRDAKYYVEDFIADPKPDIKAWVDKLSSYKGMPCRDYPEPYNLKAIVVTKSGRVYYDGPVSDVPSLTQMYGNIGEFTITVTYR